VGELEVALAASVTGPRKHENDSRPPGACLRRRKQHETVLRRERERPFNELRTLLWRIPRVVRCRIEDGRKVVLQPLRGIRSKTRWYQVIYDVIGRLYPVFRRLVPRYVTTTVNMGLAMIEVAASGYEKPILSTVDINRAAARSPRYTELTRP